MTVLNHHPLTVRDRRPMADVALSVHDDRQDVGEPITIGVDIRRDGTRVSIGVALDLYDAIRVRDELNRLINERTYS